MTNEMGTKTTKTILTIKTNCAHMENLEKTKLLLNFNVWVSHTES